MKRICTTLLLIGLSTLAACQSTGTNSTPTKPTVTLDDEKKSPVLSQETREMLSELVKGHNDKVQLSWYATSFLKKLDPPVKQFATHMGKEHKELLARLEAWSKKNDVKLKFKFTDDLYGRARKDMEKMQGDEFQASGGDDFQRDFLMLMSVDYLTQTSFIKALLTTNPDPELTAYLKDSLAAHEKDRTQIREFLKHYKYKE